MIMPGGGRAEDSAILSEQTIHDGLQVIALVASLLFVSWLISRIIGFLDKKITHIDLDKGWVKNVVDGPRWMLGVGLFSLLSGIVTINIKLATSNIGVKLLGVVLTEIGFALFIGFLLYVSIEMSARVEHDRQISRGILSYLYRVRLDNRMFIAAEEHIFRAPFYRRDMKVEYEFVKKEKGKVLLKYTIEYIVENIGDRDGVYEIKTFVEREANACGPRGVFKDDLGLHRISIGGREIPPIELAAAKGVQQEDANFIVSRHALELTSGASAIVKSVSFVEKCERDGELWRSIFPADGVEVRLIWRPEMDFEVFVEAVHPEGAFDNDPHQEPGLLEARLTKPLFPQNGLYFWWSPRRPGNDPGEEIVNAVAGGCAEA